LALQTSLPKSSIVITDQLNVTVCAWGSIPFECGFVDDVIDTTVPAAICPTWTPVRLTVWEWSPFEISMSIATRAASCAALMVAL